MTYEHLFPLLLELGRKYGFRPDLPLGMPEFLSSFVGNYQGNAAQVEQWLDGELSKTFAALVDRPRWIQDPEWPLRDGIPMVFVGQIDREIDTMDVSFYLFKDKHIGVTKVVTQVVGKAM
jgi:hypothetical protein